MKTIKSDNPDSNSAFDIADSVIREVYPPDDKHGDGFWGCQKISNYGTLRGAISRAVNKKGEK